MEKVIRYSINNPVTVIVFFTFICLFGFISIFSLPVQLTPTIDKPEITVTTFWEGASPQEVEQEIIERQEDKLKSIQGLKKMTSNSVESTGTVLLEFFIGTDMSRALLDVSEKLRQVSNYPQNVDQPVVQSGGSEQSNAISWFVLKSDNPDKDIENEMELLEDVVKPHMERVNGVSSINIFGGNEKELHISIDPHKLASNRLTIQEISAALTSENINVSAGNIDEQKRSYIIRTAGQYNDINQVRNTVIKRTDKGIVYVKDIGDVTHGFKEQRRIVRAAGKPTIAMNAMREAGSNVIEVMNGLKEKITYVNENILKQRGLALEQVYDETTYIHSAIDLVLNNLWVGSILAIIILLLFLRSISSTLIIGMSIPISIIGSFIFLLVTGRNINVISLAGMAFAAGIIVDNSIVVLENIYRHMQMGKDPMSASVDATIEVWGAVLASTLTTIAVFVPIIFIREEVGQLFKDISIAISFSIILSLVVSIIFIPMVSARMLKVSAFKKKREKEPLSVRFGDWFVDTVKRTVKKTTGGALSRILVVGGFTLLSIGLSIFLSPPMTYLPAGNRNLVIGFLIPPPGYSTGEFVEIAKKIEKKVLPYYRADMDTYKSGKMKYPPISNFFYVSTGQNVFMGLASRDPSNVKPLVNLIHEATADLPGIFSFAMQTSLFERGLSSGNSIDLEITGFDYDKIKTASLSLIPQIAQKIGFPRPSPPNFNLGGNEIRMILDKDKAAAAGISVSDAGFILRTMIDGSIIGDYWDMGKRRDIKLLSANGGMRRIEDIENIPVFIKDDKIVPLHSFATFLRVESPTQINHIEEKRSVNLVVAPPDNMELETAMKILKDEIITPMRKNGAITDDIETNLAGTADKLTSAMASLQFGFLLAIIITYLLMSSLFESFLYSFVIMFSVPLSWVGGVIGLNLMHKATGQQMDILTMLGFVILIGTVVNNAILIVHQALNLMREEGMDANNAIAESAATRVRPIFMTTVTTVLGMLPLIFFPGEGSELYRGLGSVVVGGLIVSTLFTLIVVPNSFSLALSFKRKLQRGYSKNV